MSTPDDMILDQINHTYEYEQFLKLVKKFHLKKFNREVNLTPQLSGNKLDLFKFYKRVVQMGGYEKLNQLKLWAQLAEPLNLPKTCTSRSYMLKQAYLKTLKDFELEFNGKIPETNELENVKTDHNFGPPVANTRTSVIAAPAEGMTPSKNIQPHPMHGVSSVNLQSLHHIQPAAIRQAAPQPSATQMVQYGPLFTRIYYSLKSELKNEMEWGLLQLINFSYYSQLGTLNLGTNIMHLILDQLLNWLVKLYSKTIHSAPSSNASDSNGGDNDYDLDWKQLTSNEEGELLIIWLILRNMIENPHIIEYLNTQLVFKDCLYFTLQFCFSSNTSHSNQIQELKQNCLDCLAEISSVLELEDSSVVKLLKNILEKSSDRYLISRSLQILNNLFRTDSNLGYFDEIDIQIVFQYCWLFEADKSVGLAACDLLLSYFKFNIQLLEDDQKPYALQTVQLGYRLIDNIQVIYSEQGGMQVDPEPIQMGWEIIEFFMDQDLLAPLATLKSKLLVKSLIQFSYIPNLIKQKFFKYVNEIK